MKHRRKTNFEHFGSQHSGVNYVVIALKHYEARYKIVVLSTRMFFVSIIQAR